MIDFLFTMLLFAYGLALLLAILIAALLLAQLSRISQKIGYVPYAV